MTYSTTYTNSKYFFPFLVMNIQFFPFLKQLIFQCVYIYEVYSYTFECLGDYHSNKRSE